MNNGIVIRALHTMDEMYAAVELQKIHWGRDDESLVPAHMMFSLAQYGGHVLGAYDGEKLVGALVGFLGTHNEEPERPAMANLQIVSKRMVVDPAYRGQGIGYRLKLAQREFAQRQGVRLAVWTFDPLMSANAHLNIRKLGGISKRYLKDYYGTAERGGLATLGSSDRLLVEWWVTHRRVEERLTGTRGDLKLAAYLQADTPIVNPTQRDEDGVVRPGTRQNPLRGTLALIEIPLDYSDLVMRDEALARQWRAHSRQVFMSTMAEGFIVTDFLHETHEGRERAFYVMSFNVGFDFRLN
ncbi:MAG: GNAT family N-acetyltransferase [Chloroflexi bacterium]|nr:GNAT family N-acetyltransferase [Chloroflexota bacterium]